MSEQFTPGPWKLGGYTVYSADDAETLIGQTYFPRGREDAREERNANANLIAAAPEVFDAAENLLNVGQFHRDDDTDSALRQLRAALAKARGEQ